MSLEDWFNRMTKAISNSKQEIEKVASGDEQDYFYEDLEQILTDADAMLRQMCNRSNRLSRRVLRYNISPHKPIGGQGE